jgi:hypothetical protein
MRCYFRCLGDPITRPTTSPMGAPGLSAHRHDVHGALCRIRDRRQHLIQVGPARLISSLHHRNTRQPGISISSAQKFQSRPRRTCRLTRNTSVKRLNLHMPRHPLRKSPGRKPVLSARSGLGIPFRRVGHAGIYFWDKDNLITIVCISRYRSTSNCIGELCLGLRTFVFLQIERPRYKFAYVQSGWPGRPSECTSDMGDR